MKVKNDAVDCLIIGAGFAGISAAYRLHAAGKSVRVLEANNRIGGRTHSIQVVNSNYVDLGGQWIGPGQNRMYQLARQFDIKVIPTYDSGMNLFEDGGKISKSAGLLPELDVDAAKEIDQISTELNHIAETIDVVSPWLSPKAQELDSQTLDSWLKQKLKTDSAYRVFSGMLKLLLAIEPCRISLLHMVIYIASSKNSLSYLVSMTGGAQQDRFAEGTQALFNKMIEFFKENIHLNCPVHTLIQDNEGVKAVTEAGQFYGRRAIVALSPVLAARIRFIPSLSADRDQLMQGMTMGSVIKCMITYKEAFWRDRGFSGQTFSSENFLISFCDNSSSSTNGGILLAFVVGNNAEKIRRFAKEERRRLILLEVQKWFGNYPEPPLHFVDLSWPDETWSRGGYFGHFPPGVWTSFGHCLRKNENRIHWAGAETAQEWYGFMEGAVESGERAAKEVLSYL